MQLGNPEIISKIQRERLIMPNIAFMQVIWLFGTAFQMKLKKKILLQHFFKRKIRASFKHRYKMKQHLKQRCLMLKP